MKTNESLSKVGASSSFFRRIKSMLVALVFILLGCLFLARNMGYIDADLFHILVSWQMLLIVLGLGNLITGHYVGGGVLLLVGGYFLYPEIVGTDAEWLGVYWPVLLIGVGLLLLFRQKNHAHCRHTDMGGWADKGQRSGQSSSVDGYITSEVTFGSVQQIVLDPVFKGARIQNTFASTVLDLRKTKLEDEVTYIDIECNFGGVELLVPNDWNVKVDADTTCAGYTDKRYRMTAEQQTPHRLIIRGDITFSGLEIKN